MIKISTTEPDAALLWELATDPLPELQELRRYWQYCDRLLNEARLDPAHGPDQEDLFDRTRLQRAFRDLADALEESAHG